MRLLFCGWARWISHTQILRPSLIRKNVTKNVSTTPARTSTAIRPPVTTVPSTSDWCWLMYLTMPPDALSRSPVFKWNGGAASQDWICAVVCRNWASSAGYSACTRAVASAAAPASTMIAPSRVHQVAASGGQPRRLSRAARGCSSAVSSSAAAHGTTTT